MAAVDRVLALLPAHARTRDAGLLQALAEVIAAELGVLEADIAELYDSWFVETAPDWVLPYLADLLGIDQLPPDLYTSLGGRSAGGTASAGVSRRAFVANTVAYRRRKGTPSAIEQVARDVTGWAARLVEYQRTLAVTTNVDQPTLDRPATASVRTGADGRLDFVARPVAQGALNPLAHTADARTTGTGRLTVYLFPDQVRSLSPALSAPGEPFWTVNPFGLDTPMYGGEPGLPVPLRPRRLLALLRQARTDLSSTVDLDEVLTIRYGGTPLAPENILAAGLETPTAAPAEVVVDPIRGRLYPYRDGQPAAGADLVVNCQVGTTAEVGAGPYDRRVVLGEVLDADPYRGGRDVRGQAAVGPAGRCATPLQQALSDAERSWKLHPETRDGTYVIVLPDNARYDGTVQVHLPAGTRLLLVAATWADGVAGHYDAVDRQAYLDGGLTVTGETGSSLVLDGLIVAGSIVVSPGHLGSLTLSQCTLAGDLTAANPGLTVRLVRTASLPVRTAPPAGAAIGCGSAAVSLELLDSSVDTPPGVPAVQGRQLGVSAEGSTVRGGVAARTLIASNSLLDGPLTVRHRQTGGLRYSYAPAGGPALRRYHCTDTPPSYASTDPGAPGYLALGVNCPAAVARGGEGGGEMGVHHHLGRLLRLDAAGRLLADYVPAGLEYGVTAPLPR